MTRIVTRYRYKRPEAEGRARGRSGHPSRLPVLRQRSAANVGRGARHADRLSSTRGFIADLQSLEVAERPGAEDGPEEVDMLRVEVVDGLPAAAGSLPAQAGGVASEMPQYPR